MGRPITTLLIDPYTLLPLPLRAALIAVDDVALLGEVADYPTALKPAAQLQPDIILLGLSAGHPEDWPIISQLSHCSPHSRVLAFTPTRQKELALAALKNGAQGCLWLDAAQPLELVKAIYTVSRGGAVLNPEVAGWVVEAMQ